MPRRAVFILLVVVLAAGAGLLVARALPGRAATPAPVEPEFVRFTESIMAAPIGVLVSRASGAGAAEVVFEIFRDVDVRMSEWKASSPLSAVNAAAGAGAVAVPEDLRAVLRRGVEIGALTDGAFDVTWAALWGLWDFTSPDPVVPAEDEIAARVARVDYRRVEIDDVAGTVRLPEAGMMLGLGAIAKGHALDRAAAALRARGDADFLVSAGGQMMVGGTRGDRPWRIGIRDPRGAADDHFAFLEVRDASVSTSGDYERFFVVDGIRYHHVLDPRTGRPARGLRSATVVCADATLADALSTALLVLGRERTLALVEDLPGVEAVLVDDEARVHVTRGLAGAVHERHPPVP